MPSITTQDHLIILTFILSINLINGILSLENQYKASNAQQKPLTWLMILKCTLGIMLSFVFEIILFTLYVLDLLKRIPPIESSTALLTVVGVSIRCCITSRNVQDYWNASSLYSRTELGLFWRRIATGGFVVNTLARFLPFCKRKDEKLLFVTAIVTSLLDYLILSLLYHFLHQSLQAKARNKLRLKACIMLYVTIAISAIGILFTGLMVEGIRSLALLGFLLLLHLGQAARYFVLLALRPRSRKRMNLSATSFGLSRYRSTSASGITEDDSSARRTYSFSADHDVPDIPPLPQAYLSKHRTLPPSGWTQDISKFVLQQVEIGEQKETIEELLSAEWPALKGHIEPDFLQRVIDSKEEDTDIQLAIEQWKENVEERVFVHRPVVLRKSS